ncbi:MAG: tetratricopeptide repeat protein [Planctomycetota bacterium]
MFRSATLLIILGAVFASCVSQKDEPQKQHPLPAPRKPAPVGRAVLLEPELRLATPNGGEFTLAARRADVRDILMSLFKDADINLVIADSVTGAVSLDFKNVGVEQALEAILQARDLTFRRDGSFLYIEDKITRVFSMDYVSNSGADGLQIWDNLNNEIDGMLSTEGSAVINPIAGRVEITDSPNIVRRIARHLREVEESLSRQVIVEAEVLEVTLNDEFRLGFSYGIFPDYLNSDEVGTLEGGTAITQTLAAGGSAFNIGILRPNELAVAVDMMRQSDQVRILSRPRVATLNNRLATLAVVERVPIIERNVVDGEGGIRTEYDIRFEDAGVSVKITPQIGEDGVIMAHIEPSITAVEGFVTTPDGLQIEPIFNVRETQTTLRVQDGQTIVIGGLRSVRKNEVVQKVPILGDIPLLGFLFRSTLQQEQQTELAIMMTPRIVGAEGERDANSARSKVMAAQRSFHAGDVFGWIPEEPGLPIAEKLPEEVKALDEGEFRILRRAKDGEKVKDGPISISTAGLAGVHLLRAASLYSEGDYRGALEHLEQSLAFDSLDGDALLLLGLIHYAEGKSEEAVEEFAKAAHRTGENPEALNNLAVLMLERGDAEGALILLERAVRIDGENAHLRNNLGVAYLRSGNTEAALSQFKEAVRLEPHHADAALNMQQALTAM